jgi:glycerophosphoryl diester phosphodiesterase
MQTLALPGRRKPYVMAHRGNRVACPENTLAAFRRALADGADTLETDLHVTADGFVCIHDVTLDRTRTDAGPAERSPLDLEQFRDYGRADLMTAILTPSSVTAAAKVACA